MSQTEYEYQKGEQNTLLAVIFKGTQTRNFEVWLMDYVSRTKMSWNPL